MNQEELTIKNQFIKPPEPNPMTRSSSLLAKVKNSFAQWVKGPDLTFEQWERLERKHSPHSSHHSQIYYRDRGL